MQTLVKWRQRFFRVWLVFATLWIFCFGDLLLVVLAASGGPTDAQLARALQAIFATPASLGCFGWIVFNTLELHLRRAAER
jgi:hypothetical protein